MSRQHVGTLHVVRVLTTLMANSSEDIPPSEGWYSAILHRANRATTLLLPVLTLFKQIFLKKSQNVLQNYSRRVCLCLGYEGAREPTTILEATCVYYEPRVKVNSKDVWHLNVISCDIHCFPHTMATCHYIA